MVGDDPSILRALSRLTQTAGFRVLSFDRPSALLMSAIPTANACLVVDHESSRDEWKPNCVVRSQHPGTTCRWSSSPAETIPLPNA
jgi:hypothetical protein